MTSKSTKRSTDPNQDYLDELASRHMALPFLPKEFDVGPSPESVRAPYAPYHWSWDVVEPLVMRSTEVMKPGPDAHRRVLSLNNPTAPGGMTSHTLVGSVQLVMPGEEAPSHHHNLTAIRFVLRGEGVSVVDGEPCTMTPGDLILTPNWAWHGHANRSDEPVMWMDVLDAPLVYGLHVALYEEYPDGAGAMQPASKAVDYSMARFGGGNLRPVRDRGSSAVSPVRRYPWDKTEAALHELAEIDADPFDGVALSYTNPETGGSVLPTMECGMQLLRPASHTRAHRHSSSTIHHVFRGQGRTIVDGVQIDWGQGDFFVIPPWAWHEHANDSAADDAFIFTASDRPVMESLQLYREDAYAQGDGYQKVTGRFSQD